MTTTSTASTTLSRDAAQPLNLRTAHPLVIDEAWRAGQITQEDYDQYCNDVQEGKYDSDPPRFIEEGNSVIFPRNRARHHILFAEKYRGMSIPEARRKMRRLWAGHSLQNDMIHYLRAKNLLR